MGLPPNKPIPAEMLTQLDYDPMTGVFRWSLSVSHRPSLAGRVAGRNHHSGYRELTYRRERYFAHRVAWAIMTGQEPPDLIDHRDGNKKNNVWSNLRAASRSQNQANRKSKSKWGKGVVLHNSGRFQAQIVARGKRYHIGIFATQDEARAAYDKKARELFGEFARAA